MLERSTVGPHRRLPILEQSQHGWSSTQTVGASMLEGSGYGVDSRPMVTVTGTATISAMAPYRFIERLPVRCGNPVLSLPNYL